MALSVPQLSVAVPAVGWVVMLAGLAVYQDNWEPKDLLRAHWFNLALEFFVLALVVYGILQNQIGKWRGAILALLAIATVRTMETASYSMEFFDATGSRHLLAKNPIDDMKVLFAGSLVASIGNFVLILVFGSNMDVADVDTGKSSAV